MNNYVMTLGWNFVSETEKAVKLLYQLNNKNDFKHLLVDLGFPLERDELPDNIEQSINNNTEKLKDLALKYGSEYVKFNNIGVSQNWSQVYDYLNINSGDVLICADPDEHPKNKGWVKAIGDVLRLRPEYGWISLTMPEHFSVLNGDNIIEKYAGDYRIWEIKGFLNWAQGGFSGQLLNKMGGVPYLESHPIYGHIETASLEYMKNLGYTWCMLPDYVVEHTDFEKGYKWTSRLLREWKNFIIFDIDKFGQISLQDFLIKKKNGEI